jgi:hypothetical protein
MPSAFSTARLDRAASKLISKAVSVTSTLNRAGEGPASAIFTINSRAEEGEES